MEKKNRNEELQSRREFFKKAAKGVLPILGAVVLAGAPAIVNAAEIIPTGCRFGCSSACSSSCTSSCLNGCVGTCKGTCSDVCSRLCNGCQHSCSGTCKSGCTANNRM